MNEEKAKRVKEALYYHYRYGGTPQGGEYFRELFEALEAYWGISGDYITKAFEWAIGFTEEQLVAPSYRDFIFEKVIEEKRPRLETLTPSLMELGCYRASLLEYLSWKEEQEKMYKEILRRESNEGE